MMHAGTAGSAGPAAAATARPVLTLVTGASARERERAIAAQLPAAGTAAVILEGLPSGAADGSGLVSSDSLLISRIAPGCLCCTGNLVLRVTLNRILRQPPTRIYIGVASSEHLDQLRSWLHSAPYDQLLELAPAPLT